MPLVDGVYAANPQVARQKAADQQAMQQSSGSGKTPGDQAGYMELDGAQKDGDCSKVDVQGGVSGELGCCNLYQPQQGAQQFKCGTCQFYSASQSQQPTQAQAAPDGDADDASSQQIPA